jgi:hypothetical protein
MQFLFWCYAVAQSCRGMRRRKRVCEWLLVSYGASYGVPRYLPSGAYL